MAFFQRRSAWRISLLMFLFLFFRTGISLFVGVVAVVGSSGVEMVSGRSSGGSRSVSDVKR